MLPKQHRLPLRTEFKRIKKDGQIFSGKFFSLLVNKQPANNQPPRFAFIVSKKIHKKATKRNRVRRVLVEAVRNILPEIKPSFDFVFLVKKTILEKKFSEIKNEVKKFFANEKIYSSFD